MTNLNPYELNQMYLFADSDGEKAPGEKTPSDLWDEDHTKHTLDDLFKATFAHRNSADYNELIEFVGKFRFYSPYNAFLIYTQRPGARFVAPAYRWKKNFGRYVKPNANPIVILQPGGPVMFVFDVSDTEAGNESPPLPPEVVNPFGVRSGKIGLELRKTTENAKRDGIRIHKQESGSQSAGFIMIARNPNTPPLQFYAGKDKRKNRKYKEIPVRYELVYNDKLNKEAQFATIVHELAHLYCGHLGTPNKKWWPDRRGLNIDSREFEAESVTYLVCERIGIDNPSDSYLSEYVGKNDKVPPMSLECVMKTAGLIETMGHERMKPRKN